MSREAVLTEMQSQIGTEIHVGPWLTMTQERINQFAEATGDHQWIHVDVERATQESPFQAPIAHGFLTLSLLTYLTEAVNEDQLPYPDVKMGINYGMNRVRFPNPVRVGVNIRARTTLQEVAEVKGNGLQIVNLITIEIEGEAKPACVAESVVRLYF